MDDRSEVRDGMRVNWNVPIPMDDGIVLRADIFRPTDEGRYPALVTYGPYGKGLAFQDGYPTAWKRMVSEHPEVARDTTTKYANWETVDPEKWVPHGYICIRIDSRGAGCSPGYLDNFTDRENKDFHDCIEWAAAQPWCNGKIGLNGISYFACSQWRVAKLQPKHLAAMCVWEGHADRYRDSVRQGGILNTYVKNWNDIQVKSVQYGRGEKGPRSRVTGEYVCGDVTLSDEELLRNRADTYGDFLHHTLDDQHYKERSAEWNRVKAPLLSAGNWGGNGLHLRGNIEGFVRAASEQKWLEMHCLEHWTEFYTDYGIDLQRRFFDHFLKGVDNGWDKQARVHLQIRHPDRIVPREEDEWPLARTRWTKFYPHPTDRSLRAEPPAADGTLSYDGLGDGVTFLTEPLDREVEVTGPIATKLRVSSSTTNADLFLVLRVFAPDGKEVVFKGAVDPHTPVAQGWLRVSHRKRDEKLSTFYRPYHTHDEEWPLTPGEPVDVDVEIWPTCIVVPPGYRIGLTVRGKDYEYDGPSDRMSNFANELKGCGPFIHVDPVDRPPEIFGGKVTLHFSAADPAHVLLPLVPPK